MKNKSSDHFNCYFFVFRNLVAFNDLGRCGKMKRSGKIQIGNYNKLMTSNRSTDKF